MARSKMDLYKRRCAQGLNHMAAAILTMNEVYEKFLPQHPEMAEELRTAMMGTALCRQNIVVFIKQAWDLDEESIQVYAG